MNSIEDLAWEALYDVADPEVGINIVDLGLIYELVNDVETGFIRITATLTSPGCPLQDELTEGITKALAGLSSNGVVITWTFSPLWSTGYITDEGREQLHALGGSIPTY